jgi:hypothetical protein
MLPRRRSSSSRSSIRGSARSRAGRRSRLQPSNLVATAALRIFADSYAPLPRRSGIRVQALNVGHPALRRMHRSAFEQEIPRPVCPDQEPCRPVGRRHCRTFSCRSKLPSSGIRRCPFWSRAFPIRGGTFHARAAIARRTSDRAPRTAAYDDYKSPLAHPSRRGGDHLSTLWRPAAMRGAYSMRITCPRDKFRLVASKGTLEPAEERSSDFMPTSLHQLLLANYERSVQTRRRA